MLCVSHLSAGYERKGENVLKDVSFSLPEGKIGVLLGPNGVGKSTLLRILSGLLKPSQGSVSFKDKDLLRWKSPDRYHAVSYLPQNLRFPPLTLEEVVLLGRLPCYGALPGREDEEEARKALALAGLLSEKERIATTLSGGQERMLGLARAVAGNPDFLLLDEPTANLDLAHKIQVLEFLRDFVREKKTVLVSLHDLEEAAEIGDVLFWMKEGKLLLSGGKETLTEENIEKTYGVKMKRIEEDGNVSFVYERKKQA